jgi:hypothetical protein
VQKIFKANWVAVAWPTVAAGLLSELIGDEKWRPRVSIPRQSRGL